MEGVGKFTQDKKDHKFRVQKALRRIELCRSDDKLAKKLEKLVCWQKERDEALLEEKLKKVRANAKEQLEGFGKDTDGVDTKRAYEECSKAFGDRDDEPKPTGEPIQQYPPRPSAIELLKEWFGEEEWEEIWVCTNCLKYNDFMSLVMVRASMKKLLYGPTWYLDLHQVLRHAVSCDLYEHCGDECDNYDTERLNPDVVVPFSAIVHQQARDIMNRAESDDYFEEGDSHDDWVVTRETILKLYPKFLKAAHRSFWSERV